MVNNNLILPSKKNLNKEVPKSYKIFSVNKIKFIARSSKIIRFCFLRIFFLGVLLYWPVIRSGWP